MRMQAHGSDGANPCDASTADSGRAVLGECPPGHDPLQTSPSHEKRLMEMRALLTRVRPSSDAEALQTLRTAFPDATLAARVAAIATRHV